MSVCVWCGGVHGLGVHGDVYAQAAVLEGARGWGMCGREERGTGGSGGIGSGSGSGNGWWLGMGVFQAGGFGCWLLEREWDSNSERND